MLNSLRMGSGSEFFSLSIIVSGWLLVMHWSACTFFALGWALCGDGARTWVTEYFDGTDWQGLPVLTDTCGEGIPDEISRIHIRAMYWALSTMSSLGYGSAPVSVTDAEFVLAIAVQVLGACSIALVFSNIAKIMARLDAVQTRFTAHLDSINEFGKFYKLPATMRAKLTEYVTFSFGVNRGISIQEVTASLPQTLRGEVLYLMHEQLLRKVPMFKKTDDMFIKALVRTLQPQVLLRGDYLFRMNEPGDCMFFIKNGCVQLKSLDGTVVFASLMPGAFLGELSMLTGQRRTASAQAVVDCVLFLIRTTDFNAVMQDFPNYLGPILEGAMEWLEQTLESNASLEKTILPNHLQVEPEPTAAPDLTQPPEPARHQRRPSRDLFLEQAVVDAEGREQAAASGYSDMRYSDAACKMAGTLLDDDVARLRRRRCRHTTGSMPTLPSTKVRGLDDAASFRVDAQPEIQSEILASIRGLQGEIQELRALVSDLHVHTDRVIAREP